LCTQQELLDISAKLVPEGTGSVIPRHVIPEVRAVINVFLKSSSESLQPLAPPADLELTDKFARGLDNPESVLEKGSNAARHAAALTAAVWDGPAVAWNQWCSSLMQLVRPASCP
jgi:hypothetical protein